MIQGPLGQTTSLGQKESCGLWTSVLAAGPSPAEAKPPRESHRGKEELGGEWGKTENCDGRKEVVSRPPAPVEVPPPSVSPMLVVMAQGSGTGRAGGDVVLARSGSPALPPTPLCPLLPATLRVKSRVSELLLYKHGEKS